MTVVAAQEYAAAIVARALSAPWSPEADLREFDAVRRLRLDSHVELGLVLRRIVDEVVARLDADRGTLYLMDHARDELVSRVAHLPELAEIRLKLGEGVAGWVARTGEAVTVPDGAHDARFNPAVDVLTGYQTRTLLAAPVRADDGTVMGVVQVLNKRSGLFDEADAERLLALGAEISRVLGETSLRSQLRSDSERPLDFRFNHIVGESTQMRAVFERIALAARTDATVLVRGESGVGKEAIARAVHDNSPRSERPFVKVDCAALPAALIENELFGHERGAFTGADRQVEGKVRAADSGTLFLDEVGELPLEVQGKLLRLLQDRAYLRVGGTKPVDVDVRFVCATHRDLEAEVAAGRFRQDLYYRLRVVQIGVPPLRERGPADLDRLIDHFFFEHRRRHGRAALRLGTDARAALHRHGWPGNVRELENSIESAVVLARGEVVGADALPLEVSRPPIAVPPPADDDVFSAPVGTLEAMEQAYIQHVLGLCDGNRSAAARVLGIGRNTLIRKLKEG
ncbi:MAG: sigma-54-dependent Fis family transcriptional regulator [Myxococcales bacterium]|nr:sigma-54-dependent Fis family transcriptional regulator [Myxococcales bacterium]